VPSIEFRDSILFLFRSLRISLIGSATPPLLFFCWLNGIRCSVEKVFVFDLQVSKLCFHVDDAAFQEPKAFPSSRGLLTSNFDVIRIKVGSIFVTEGNALIRREWSAELSFGNKMMFVSPVAVDLDDDVAVDKAFSAVWFSVRSPSSSHISPGLID
jgi:hypothetical protein